MNTTNQSTGQPSSPPDSRRWIKSILRLTMSFLLPVGILAFALGAYVYQMETRPRAQRRPPARQARLVQVEPMHKTSSAAVLSAMGTVQAAREITIRPEVTGVIIAMDPEVLPGGILRKGQVLYEIDSRDYQAAVRQRESEVELARLNLKLESGSQTIARHEYGLLEEIIEQQDEDLILRKPHLEQARAALDAAQAMLEQAKLNVQRCTIRAPFNAVIKHKYADLGARVSPTDPLVSVIGIDEFWIELLIPVDQLPWVQVSDTGDRPGSAVRIYNPAAWGEDINRTGNLVRMLGHLEEQGRMARLLASIQDPLGLEEPSAPPLLIGSYVRAEILGRNIPDIFPVHRRYIRGGNEIWIMNDQGKLEIRPAQIVFRNKETVYVRDGFQEGEKIVITDLSTPVEGMPLRTESFNPHEPAANSGDSQRGPQ